ncbi:MAG: glutamate synthase large subunit [Phycisphaerae bacterium]
MSIQRPTDHGLYETRREHDACGIGAVVDMSGRKDHSIVELANQIVMNLQHRGAAGSDESTGDGAGILFQIPHEFFGEELGSQDRRLPEPGKYGVAMVFGPRDDAALRAKCDELLEQAVVHYGMKVIGWRDVPGDNTCLGELARLAEPSIKELFIDGAGLSDELLESKLFMARKRAERMVNDKFGGRADDFYVVSMSCRTICYKGMFLSPQLFGYYPDLSDPRVTSALALVHQRYSTNTFPNWKLAQPFRMIAHNGEINTLSGNRNRMRAREMKMKCPKLGEDLSDLMPVLTEGASDSAQFDQCLELLVRAGRSMPHAMMMMVPEAFGPAYHISADKRAFYEYHASIMEPWDGPAALVFTDGRLLGGTLDRNGLRPARYVVTTDGLVVLGSEVGVVEFPPEKIQQKGRLQPGKMFLVDTEEGRIIVDNEIKARISRQKPYRRWLEQNRIELRGLFNAAKPEPVDRGELIRKMRSHGYTREEMEMILKPMAVDGQEPVGSMGNDAPLAVLSDKPRSPFHYFKQMFAQVTNPAIDPYREGLVMSLMLFTGKRKNLLDETPQHCRQLKLSHPILTNEDIQRLRAANVEDFRVSTIDALFDATTSDPGYALRRALDELVAAAEAAIRNGASLIIISDRKATEQRAAIPALLACAAAHHGMLKRKLRGEAGIVIESGEPREVMHFCLLCGYGANAVNPYLAFESLQDMLLRGELGEEMDTEDMVDNYITAVKKGILKTMSKMGISTLRSYRSAQLFEAIGLNRDVIDRYFTGTTSRIGGVGLDELARDALQLHRRGYTAPRPGELELDFGGEYSLRLDGENHLWNETTVARLQHAVKYDDNKAYQEYASAVNEQARKLCTLRGLFEFKEGREIPLEEVEPATEIVKRFCTGAMSHGSISKEAHECMAVAMNRLGGMSNTGEGGEDPIRYEPDPSGDSRNSAIKQVASGRFGVTMNYLAHAREIQIKVAQGAKPGEGGQLPGHKVTEEIARLRFSTPGVTLISPPPHHDIYSIEDLAQLIYDLKCSNPGVKVSVKLVSEVGVGTIAAGVSKGNADEVLISGYDGGTGASPLSSIKHAGCPWELGLAETQQVLVMNNLRDRIRVQTDGQLKTGRDVAVAALLGAEHFGFGTGALVAMGCIIMRKCHKGTCPVGIATQDPELRKRFAGKPEHLTRMMLFIAEETRQIMAKLGFRKLEEMVGRVDMLRTRKAIEHYKARGLDFSSVFAVPDSSDGRGIRLSRDQANTLETHVDWEILDEVSGAIESGKRIEISRPVRNVNRTVGTILSNRIVKAHGPEGLPDDTIHLQLTGSAGQSFGAFLVPGVTLKLTGDANDYLGKGLSGGRIVVVTPDSSPFDPADNIIVGNTLLYGATRGEVYINGLAGERFCVRNSGAEAVVEGVGDHGCEYMTGGCVVVLGRTGRNFAAGMSGGIAYVLDEQQLFDTRCNLDMVDLETVWQQEDRDRLRELIERHHKWTGSRRAKWILDSWREMVGKFVKVMPIDYRRALERQRQREERGAESVPATEEVFGG